MVKTDSIQNSALKKKKYVFTFKGKSNSIIPLLKKITTFLMGGSQDSIRIPILRINNINEQLRL